MALRKFGIERGRPQVDQEDPQGLSKTALHALEGEEPLDDEPSTDEAQKPAQSPERP